MKIRDYLTEQQVAQAILQQIKTLDKWALPAWGAKDYVTSKDSLQFDVRGSKLRGRVIVKYDKGKDLYNIEFGTIKNLEWKPVKTLKGIHAEDLVKIIDSQVG